MNTNSWQSLQQNEKTRKILVVIMQLFLASIFRGNGTNDL